MKLAKTLLDIFYFIMAIVGLITIFASICLLHSGKLCMEQTDENGETTTKCYGQSVGDNQ